MNGQLKLLIVVIAIIAGFLFLQEKFKFLNIISITDNKPSVEGAKDGEQSKDDENRNYVEISTGGDRSVRVNVEIAKTPNDRILGLSNRKYLGTYDGMLFIFDEVTQGSFWMKDMLLPLDIIFFDSDKFVVDIKDNNEPCSENYCPSISPSTMYKYVLEVNANFAHDNGINLGNSMQIHLVSDN